MTAAGCMALALLNACGSNTTELAAANAENERLRGELARAPAGGGADPEELREAAAERDAARAARDNANRDLTDARGQLSTARTDLAEANKANTDLTRTRNTLSTALARTRSERDSARAALTETGGTLSMTEGERDKANMDLTETRRTLSMTEGERDAALRALAAANMPNAFAVPAGATMRLGASHFTCGAGDAPCRVEIAEDGAVTATGALSVAAAPPANVMMAEGLALSFPAGVFDENGRFAVTVAAGMTAMVGGANLACGADGGACLVVVTTDNMVSSSGGAVTVTMPRMADVDMSAVAAVEGFTLSARTLTVAAGMTAFSGRVDFACPAGGDDCAVVVDATGSVSYSGGKPEISGPRMSAMVDGDAPAGYTVAPAMLSVAAGTTAMHGVFDIACPGTEACSVVVDAMGAVSWSGGEPMVTVARAVIAGPDDIAPRLAESGTGLTGNDAALAPGFFILAENTMTMRNDDWVRFSCPDGAAGGCGVLVAGDGSVTASGGAAADFLGTVFFGTRGAIAPMAASTVAAVVPTPPDAMVVRALLARRTGATSISNGARNANALTFAGANSWGAGDLLAGRGVGELPMRTVTVGDPKGTGDVQTYMPGARDVYTGSGGSPGASAVTEIVDVHSSRATPIQTDTYDQYQFPTYVPSDADVVSAIELDGDRRVIVKLGSKYTASGDIFHGLAFNDMKFPTEVGTLPLAFSQAGSVVRNYNERNHGDLTIAFGKDAYGPDPHGDGAHYWRAGVEFDAGNAGPDGAYQLWLSNQAGSVSATSAKYLQYAAYGLFNFMDGALDEALPVGGGDAYTPVSARLQGLHFGFDTPATGATDSIASLRALSSANVGATYSGRTTALAMLTTGEDGLYLQCQTGTCVDRVSPTPRARSRCAVRRRHCCACAATSSSTPASAPTPPPALTRAPMAGTPRATGSRASSTISRRSSAACGARRRATERPPTTPFTSTGSIS